MKSEFYDALDLIQKEKGIPKEYMLEKIKAGIIASIRRDKQVLQDNIDVAFDEVNKTMRVFIKKTVVEEVNFPSAELSLDQAQQINPNYQIGDVVEFDCDTSSVGRIAAKVGKNVIIQAINEAVNGSLLQEFEDMKGTIVTGVVSRVDERGKCIHIEIKDYEMQMSEKELINFMLYQLGALDAFVKLHGGKLQHQAIQSRVLAHRAALDIIIALNTQFKALSKRFIA